MAAQLEVKRTLANSSPIFQLSFISCMIFHSHSQGNFSVRVLLEKPIKLSGNGGGRSRNFVSQLQKTSVRQMGPFQEGAGTLWLILRIASAGLLLPNENGGAARCSLQKKAPRRTREPAEATTGQRGANATSGSQLFVAHSRLYQGLDASLPEAARRVHAFSELYLFKVIVASFVLGSSAVSKPISFGFFCMLDGCSLSRRAFSEKTARKKFEFSA